MSNLHQKQPTRSPRRAVGHEFSDTPVTHLREATNVITCKSLTAGETASFTDESPLLGQRLSKIAHIRRALQKAKDPARWAPLASSTSFSAQAAHFHSPPDSGHVAASH